MKLFEKHLRFIFLTDFGVQVSFIKYQIYMKLWSPGTIASKNNMNRIRRGRSHPTVPPFQQKNQPPDEVRRTGLKLCAHVPPPSPHGGVPTRPHRLSPLKNQRDEEQRQPGTMRSRLPRTACLLRLIALCILLAHSAAYFGSAYYYWIFCLFFIRSTLRHD